MRRYLEIQLRVILVIVASLIFPSPSESYEFELPSEEYRWIKVETTNFTVFSNAEAKIAGRTSESLEQLWAVLAKHFDGVPSVSPVPTYVYDFDFFTDAYPPYGPFSKGRPKKSGGYVARRPLGTYVAIVERDYRYPDLLDINHGFVHAVLEAHYPELPLWMEEGLAEYYSSFHIKEGKAHLGYRMNRHVAWLRNNRMIPFSELFAIDRSSPEYNEKDRTGVFYAESWLLIHMLLTERPDGRAQTLLYAELLREGYDRDSAFTKAFDTTYDDLQTELKKYIRRRSYHYTVFPLSRKIIRNTEISKMTRTEVLFRLGDLLGSDASERNDFAAEHFKAALAIDESYGPAFAGIGFLDETAGRREAAHSHYERAATLTPDDYRVNLLLGISLFNGLESVDSHEARVAQLERARSALRRAADLRPELAEAWAALGSTYLSDDEKADLGIEALERAMELQPKRPDVGINLTTLYVRKGSAGQADSVIARMGAAGVEAQAVCRAREIAEGMKPEVEPSNGFSWIVPGELAAMPLPGRDRPLDQDAAFLEQEGIGVLVSLTEEPPDAGTLDAHSIVQRHLPVQDFTPPSPEQMTEFAAFVRAAADNGTPVGVHCTAGLGRSGTMAAGYLVAGGASADEAIETVRSLRPGSIETDTQEEAIREFETSLNRDRERED